MKPSVLTCNLVMRPRLSAIQSSFLPRGKLRHLYHVRKLQHIATFTRFWRFEIVIAACFLLSSRLFATRGNTTLRHLYHNETLSYRKLPLYKMFQNLKTPSIDGCLILLFSRLRLLLFKILLFCALLTCFCTRIVQTPALSKIHLI